MVISPIARQYLEWRVKVVEGNTSGAARPGGAMWSGVCRPAHPVCSLPKGERLNLSQLMTGAPPEAVDMVTQLLAFSPDKRLTVQQATASLA